MVDGFIRDLKDAVWDAKRSPAGKGTMVSLYGACSKRIIDIADFGLRSGLLSSVVADRDHSRYLPFPCPLRKADDIFGPDLGLGNSSAIGPQMVGSIVSAFLDALYQA